ncbi:unnamed protein product [Onchocerca ochengi]|uniref:Protection of telomeres protein 1 n=1 Tax=Onchocerca ochengi TaxID=42157 RepID=A0A182EAK1_ONCOC|nr:unnamed protein product [Onchocerca ochengi]
MYIDILWVMELFFVVFLTSFSLYATYLLPLQYCDLLHRCAAHLGKWERLDRLTIAAISNNSGSSSSSNSYYNSNSMTTSTCSSISSGSSNNSSSNSSYGAGGSIQITNSIITNTICTEWSKHNGLYADGSVVRHQGQLYKAVAIADTLGVAAEPGNSDHSRFYRIASDPVTLIGTMAVFQVVLIAIQFWLLILTTDWQHIVTLVLLIFANYLLLAKTFKDRVIIGRIYKPSPEDLQLIRQLQQYFSSMKQYQYITLGELDALSSAADENLKVNIYAFVANLKVRSQSVDTLENGDIKTELELRDGSTDTYAACIIYSNSSESFSDQIQIAQIIRMHRAKIKKATNGKLFIYGKLRVAGFAVLLFSGQLGDSFNPLYQSSANFTVPSDHKERITSLRNFFMMNQPIIIEDPPTTSDDAGISDDHLIATTSTSPLNQIATYANKEETNEIIKNANIRCLNELVPRDYSDICVQAIALFMGDRNNVILRCWDTTSPPRKIFMLNTDCVHEVICRDEKLEMTAADYWCDIVLYEEHGDFARNNVKCGDILLLINMHFYQSKNDIALTMHGGRCFKRSIVILDDNNELKHYLLRTIDEFKANRVSLCSNIQIDVENERSIEDQIPSTQPLDEINDLTEQQMELWKCWASVRMRQIHAVQLAWIYSYAWKKKQQINLQLERSCNLAKMAVKFTIRQILQLLFVYNKDLFTNLAKLSLQQRNTLFMNFLLTYMEGAYGDGLISELKDEHKRSDDNSKQMKISKKRKGENSKDDTVQSLLWNLLPGTVLKLSGFDLFVFVFILK